MARSAKTGPGKSEAQENLTAPEPVADAESETIAGPDTAPIAESADELSPVAVNPQETPVDQPEPMEAPSPEPAPTPAANAIPVPPAPPARPQRSGLFPLLIGGAVVAGLGFLAGWFVPRSTPDTTATLETQSSRIAGLEAQIAALPPPAEATDLTPLTAEIAALSAEVTNQLGPLADRLAALDDRIVALERTPAADGTLSDTAIASWEAELETVRADLAAQQDRMQALADQATERLDAAQSTVSEIEQNATASATAVLQRASLSRMQAAVDSGTPFDAALDELVATGVDVPAILRTTATDGVPTIARLANSFPGAARAALATARAEGLADDGDNRFVSFLRSQFDVRSVTPREGGDPDAILSRAEAALAEARLSDALAEVAALPEVVRADMSGWITQAEARAAVVAALQSLSETLPATSN